MHHAYVVPAYGHSPHLEACLASLVGQQGSTVTVVTSTPFTGLDAVAAAYGARVVVHGPNAGIGHDWNAAYAAADADLVTIAHQDDVYLDGHSTSLLEAFQRRHGALLAFTDCREVSEGVVRPRNRTLLMKSVLRELAFAGRNAIRMRALKRLLLRFGNPVPCPAVTFNKALLPEFRFRVDMRTNMDWAAWVDLAGLEGEFLYLRDPLVLHRIHAGSETTACLEDGARKREDEELFSQFWPRPVARLLARVYALSYGTNG